MHDISNLNTALVLVAPVGFKAQGRYERTQTAEKDYENVFDAAFSWLKTKARDPLSRRNPAV